MNGEIYDKALFLYQSALNLCADIDKQYQADATVIIVTSLTSMCTCFLSLNACSCSLLSFIEIGSS